MKKLMILIALLAIAGTASAALEVGDIILINAEGNSTADGTDEATHGGNIWNLVDFADALTGSLQLADDTDEGVTIIRTAGNVTTGYKNTAATGLSGLSWVDTGVPVNLFQYVNDGLSSTFTISGLDNTLKYDIDFAGSGNTSAYDGQTVDVNGSSQSNYSPYDAASGTAPLDLSWTSVSLDGSDNLVFTITGNAADRATITALRIVAVPVPEPATVGMLGLGALIALFVRRVRG